MHSLIKALELPIGYVNTYLMFDEEGFITLGMDKRCEIEAQFNPVRGRSGIATVKDLLLCGLGIEELQIKEQWKFCRKCKKTFPPKDEVCFCSKCGCRLESDII